jgi:hypothetical protein
MVYWFIERFSADQFGLQEEIQTSTLTQVQVFIPMQLHVCLPTGDSQRDLATKVCTIPLTELRTFLLLPLCGPDPETKICACPRKKENVAVLCA